MLAFLRETRTQRQRLWLQTLRWIVTSTAAARLVRTEIVALRLPWRVFARADSDVTDGSGQPLAVLAYSNGQPSETL